MPIMVYGNNRKAFINNCAFIIFMKLALIVREGFQI